MIVKEHRGNSGRFYQFVLPLLVASRIQREDEVKKIHIVKFNAERDEEFDLWCTCVKAYLASRSVMDVVREDMSGTTEDIDMGKKRIVKKRIAIARSFIIQS